MGYYSVFKKDILIHVTIGMKLEDVLPNEICQTQKDKYHMIPFIGGP